MAKAVAIRVRAGSGCSLQVSRRRRSILIKSKASQIDKQLGRIILITYHEGVFMAEDADEQPPFKIKLSRGVRPFTHPRLSITSTVVNTSEMDFLTQL